LDHRPRNPPAFPYTTLFRSNPNNRPLPAGVNFLTGISGTENAPAVIDRWWNVTAQDFSTNPAADMVFTYRDSEWSSGTNIINERDRKSTRLNSSHSQISYAV